jgi:adenylate kinase
MNLILLGGPGSGKGTQAGLLEKEFGIIHISTGDLFRENIGNETELGILAKSYIDLGNLVPNAVTIDMVRSRLEEPDTIKGVVFDGFPRTITQAEALEEILREKGQSIDAVLNILVREEEIVRRLSGRLICGSCQHPFHKEFTPFEKCPYEKCQGEFIYQREDDKPETVRARLRVFHERTAPLIEYYDEKGQLVNIDGEGTVEQVAAAILAGLNTL